MFPGILLTTLEIFVLNRENCHIISTDNEIIVHYLIIDLTYQLSNWVQMLKRGVTSTSYRSLRMNAFSLFERTIGMTIRIIACDTNLWWRVMTCCHTVCRGPNDVMSTTFGVILEQWRRILSAGTSFENDPSWILYVRCSYLSWKL